MTNNPPTFNRKQILSIEHWYFILTSVQQENLFSDTSGSRSDIQVSKSLSDEIKENLFKITGKRTDGILLISLAVLSILLGKHGLFKQVINTSFTHSDPGVDPFFLLSPYSKEQSLKGILESIKANVRDSIKYKGFSLDDLLEHLKVNNAAFEKNVFNIGIFVGEKEKYGNLASKYTFCILLENAKTEKPIFTFYSKLDNTSTSRLITDFFSLLDQSLIHPDLVLNSLQIKSPKSILSGRMTTSNDSMEDLITRFNKHVKANPNKACLVENTQAYSYEQIDKFSDYIAAKMLDLLKPNSNRNIAVIGTSDVKFITAMLAIAKVGACLVPIDSSLPLSRIKYILEDVSPQLICLADSSQIPKTNITELRIELKESEQGASGHFNNKKNCGQYVIYTSGSTGKPKGVLIDTESLCNLVDWHITAFNVSQESSSTYVSSIGFDAFQWEIWPYLVSGATLYKIEKQVKQNLNLLCDSLKKWKISHTFLPTSLVESLEEYGKKLPEELIILTGGEALKKVPDIPSTIVNNYGPSEYTVVTSSIKVNAKESIIPIGKPIDNTTVAIVSSENEILPIQCKGEICISGLGLAAGYLNDVEKTKRQFTTIQGEDGIYYKSGDHGYIDEKGHLIFVGRNDDQIQVNGYRVELLELESKLESHPDIIQSAVIWDQDNRQIVVFYSAKSELDLKDFFLQDLPTFMIPERIIRLDSMPINVNGKIDKKYLLDQLNQPQEIGLEATSKKEKLLLDIWCTILNKDKIYIDQNYFHLGGDSVKAIQIVSRVHSLGYTLQLSDIYKKPTIKELSIILKEKTKIENVVSEITSFPPSPLQTKFLNTIGFNLDYFTQSICVRIHDNLDNKRLKEITSSLLKVHPILSIQLHEDNEGMFRFQACKQDVNRIVSEIYIDNLDELSNVALDWFKEIELKQGILFKIGQVHCQEVDYLLIIINHFVIDTVSWNIILDDLHSLLENKSVGPYTYSNNFAEWVDKIANRKDLFFPELPIWKHQLSQAISNLSPVNSNKVVDEKRIQVELDENSTKQIHELRINKFGSASLEEVLIVMITQVITTTFGVNEFTLGIENNGRLDFDGELNLSKSVGWFTSIFPLLVAADKDFGKMLRSIIDRLRKIPNNGHGFELLVGEGLIEDYKFQIGFNYHGEVSSNNSNKVFSFVNLDSSIEQDPNNPRLFELEFNSYQYEGKILIDILYASEQLEGKIETIKQSIHNSVKGLIEYGQKSDKLLPVPAQFSFKNFSIDQLDNLAKDLDLDDIFHLSPLQKGIVYHSLNDPNSDMYVMQFSFKISGELDSGRLELAFNKLISRHESLRSNIVFFDDEPLMVIHKEKRISINFYSENETGFIEQIEQKERQNRFDLVKGDLFRIALIKTSSDDFQIIWTFHHVILDGWSVGIIYDELIALYGGQEPEQLSSSIKDYLNQLSPLDEDWKNFWRDYLSEFEEPSSLPKIGSNQGAYQKEFLEAFWSKPMYEKFCEVTQSNGITVFTALQTLWAIVVGRYTSQTDIVFGKIISGRSTSIPEVDKIVGVLINAVPVRYKLGENPTFIELCKKMQEEFHVNEKYYDQSLASVQSLHQLKHNLLNHILIFENYPVKEYLKSRDVIYSNQGEEAHWRIEDVKIFDHNNYDLNVVFSVDDSLMIRFDFNRNTYSKDLLSEVLDAFNELVDRVVENENQNIFQLRLLSVEQSNRIIELTNNQKPLFSLLENNIPQVLKERAKKFYTKTAIRFKDEDISYEDLDKITDRFSSQILSKDIVDPGKVIAILIEDKINYLVTALSILKAGCVFVPIPSDLPKERINYILRDASPSLVITELELLSLVEASVPIDIFEHMKTIEPSVSIKEVKVGLMDPAYIIYTSGTTGNPKGTIIRHRGLINTAFDQIERFGMNSDDVVMQFASFSFDASIYEIFIALFSGATLVLIDETIKKEKKLFLDYLSKNKITTAVLTPSFMSAFQPTDFKNLKRIISAGEVVNHDFAIKVAKYLDFYNAYGPTENSICTSVKKIEPSNKVNSSIGKPISNVVTYVLNEHKELLPIGCVGNLYVGGNGLATGYLNRAELTDQKFVSLPFDQLNSPLYDTGDLAWVDNNGDLCYAGRSDQQVKLRGYRIELDEIRTVIVQHKGVMDAYVRKYDRENTSELIAYIITDTGTDQFVESLKGYLARYLPTYMIPSHYILMDEFPLNSNGKIDLNSLPGIQRIKTKDVSRPETQMEKELFELWTDVLGHSDFGIHDNFFDVGGDSLLAVSLNSKISNSFPEITISDLFSYTTIEKLSSFISQFHKNEDNQQEIIGINLDVGFYQKNTRTDFERITLDIQVQSNEIGSEILIGSFLFCFTEYVKDELVSAILHTENVTSAIHVDFNKIESRQELFKEVKENLSNSGFIQIEKIRTTGMLPLIMINSEIEEEISPEFFPLRIHINTSQIGLVRLELTYIESRFDESIMSQLLNNYSQIVENISLSEIVNK